MSAVGNANIDNQFVNCSINSVNGGIQEEKQEPFDEVIQNLCIIWRSGKKELIERVVSYIKDIIAAIESEESDNTDDIRQPISRTITDSEHPADNLVCLKSMVDFMKASAIGMGSAGIDLARSEWDGMVYMLKIISNDLEVISDNL